MLNAWINAALVENGKFLLAARKCRRATSTDYIISIDSEDMSRGSNTYVGKLRYHNHPCLLHILGLNPLLLCANLIYAAAA